MQLQNKNEKVLFTFKGSKNAIVNNTDQEIKQDSKIILTDERLYMVREIAGILKVVCLENKKIDRLFFENDNPCFIVEIEDTLYPFEIYTDILNLRKLCQIFKNMRKNRTLVLKSDIFLSPVVTVLEEENPLLPSEKKAVSEESATDDLIKNDEPVVSPISSSEQKSVLTESKISTSEISEPHAEFDESSINKDSLTLDIDDLAEKRALFDERIAEQPKKKWRLFGKK